MFSYLIFIDECTIKDFPEKVFENVRIVVQKLRLVGLELHRIKCELGTLGHETTTQVTLTLDLFQELLPGVKILKYS